MSPKNFNFTPFYRCRHFNCQKFSVSYLGKTVKRTWNNIGNNDLGTLDSYFRIYQKSLDFEVEIID